MNPYDDAGRRYLTENKNGTTVVSREERGFDDTDRVLWIEHRGASDDGAATRRRKPAEAGWGRKG